MFRPAAVALPLQTQKAWATACFTKTIQDHSRSFKTFTVMMRLEFLLFASWLLQKLVNLHYRVANSLSK